MSIDNDLTEDENYLKALKQARHFHPEPLGCTEYFGKTEADKIYPRQLNTLLLLTLNLHKKVDYLTTLIQTQNQTNKLKEKSVDTNKILATEIEALTSQLKNLPVDKRPTPKVTRNLFGIKE